MRPSIRQFAALAESTHRIGEGIIARRRDALARGITLIESTRADHREQAVLLLDWLSNGRAKQLTDSNIKAEKFKSPTLRIGVAGPPGAGKSTFIEALGMRFVSSSHRVAVVPIDPSSHISGGSILGDKTRMEQLSRSDSAYVRATPTVCESDSSLACIPSILILTDALLFFFPSSIPCTIERSAWGYRRTHSRCNFSL